MANTSGMTHFKGSVTADKGFKGNLTSTSIGTETITADDMYCDKITATTGLISDDYIRTTYIQGNPGTVLELNNFDDTYPVYIGQPLGYSDSDKTTLVVQAVRNKTAPGTDLIALEAVSSLQSNNGVPAQVSNSYAVHASLTCTINGTSVTTLAAPINSTIGDGVSCNYTELTHYNCDGHVYGDVTGTYSAMRIKEVGPTKMDCFLDIRSTTGVIKTGIPSNITDRALKVRIDGTDYYLALYQNAG